MGGRTEGAPLSNTMEIVAVQGDSPLFPRCLQLTTKHCYGTPGTSVVVLPFGLDRPQTREWRGVFFLVLRSAQDDIVGMLHVRALAGSSHVCALVSVSGGAESRSSPGDSAEHETRLQDYMALWTPGSTRQERCRDVPVILTALGAAMVAGDRVVAACLRSLLPMFETAGWRVSHRLIDHESSRETVVVAGAADSLDEAAMRTIRGLDGRNPTLAERVYSCRGYGDLDHHPACRAWGIWLCETCGDVAFCTREGLQEHQLTHDDGRDGETGEKRSKKLHGGRALFH